MPNTPRLQLPYPTLSDQADVPADIQALAEALDLLVYIPGELRDFAMVAAPAKWLVCDGSVLEQADYPALHAAILATWNTGGETASQFRLPDIRGRARIGAGTGAGLTARAVGAAMGEEAHRLLAAESGVNPAGATGDENASHVHGPAAGVGFVADSGTLTGFEIPAGSGGRQMTQASSTGGQNVHHQHGLAARDADSLHNTMQPSAVVLCCIYAGA